MSGEGAIVNPKTVMDWKSEELHKIINRYKPKDIFNVDETGLFYNLKPSKTMVILAMVELNQSRGLLFC